MRLTHALGAFLFALSILAPRPGLADDPADNDSRSAQARAELSALHDRIAQVRRQIAAGSDQRSELSDALAQAQSRISDARRRLDRLDDDIAEHKQRIKRLKQQRDAERDRLSGELDALAAQVRSAYETGRMSRMRLLLSGAAPERIGRMLNYYQYFSEAQSRQVDHLKSALARLASKQQSLENERAQLAAQREARAATLDSLEASEQKQQATLAALEQRLSSHRSSLSDMRAQQARLKKLLNSVQTQLSDLPPVPSGVPFYKLKGRMHPPVPAKKVLARYGQTKSGGPLRWQGEWFAAPQGAPVHAVAGGRVVYVGYMKGYGLIVIVDHGHGYYSLYGHAAASYVDVGDAVSTGQTIATAGHSGGHSKSGIYFEIRHGEEPVDPSRWLSG
ncbi:murein hydrolase activator EnvC family protein [Salinisphaera sp.]|uniref:murein hydrolase activator EnvC family protein n=1 Tax=Salinisphaera sp. TaxID=1914330 RepID=UPI002D7716AD|nr:peptidoglycan DD-metalloendopeptidase family protein [Salinisphaera sp.]HET7315461.1 peptidoglycan DD-metalloendopeptidase family protein [Salinisphaera sp.]